MARRWRMPRCDWECGRRFLCRRYRRRRRFREFVNMERNGRLWANVMPMRAPPAKHGLRNRARWQCMLSIKFKLCWDRGLPAKNFRHRRPAWTPCWCQSGGGGLIGGIASWYGGTAKVMGVEPQAAPTLAEALKAGRPVDAETGSIAADSLAPRRVGELMFPIAQAYVEKVVLVSDDDIRQAQAALWEVLRLVAEPGGAAALAGLLGGGYRPRDGERVGVIISGGNTTAVDFGERVQAK